SARQVLLALATSARAGEIGADAMTTLKEKMSKSLAADLAAEKSGFRFESALVLTSFKNEKGVEEMRRVLGEKRETEARRLLALDALAAVKDAAALKGAEALLGDRDIDAKFRGQVLTTMGRLDDDKVAVVVLKRYADLETEARPKAVELLTQRPTWG